MRLFHGTRGKLPLGVELVARTRNRTPFERLLESFRPPSANSRLSSFFMTADPDEVELLGPVQKYIYEVETVVPPTKASFGWAEEIQRLGGCNVNSGKCQASKIEENLEKITQLATKYWSGARTKYGFEYLSPVIVPLRLVQT